VAVVWLKVYEDIYLGALRRTTKTLIQDIQFKDPIAKGYLWATTLGTVQFKLSSVACIKQKSVVIQ
jgi:hypothetical protein